MISPEAKREAIMKLVCDAFGLTTEGLKGASRKREFHNARCVYSYLTKHLLGDTYARIGFELNRDHTTALYQVQSMNDLIFIKDPTAITLKKIEHELLQKQLI